MTRIPPALRIVPPHVKRRVAAVVLLALLGVGGAASALRGFPLAACGVGLWALALGGYGGWCLWPRWRLGVNPDLLGELPGPLGQRVRLTFDDGPTPELTDRLLDALRQHAVQASFFVLTGKARKHAALIRRIVAEGHVLGLHGEDHRVALFRRRDELAASLLRARRELEALAGRPVVLYRPSHGWKNRALLSAVRDAGLRMVFWDYGVWDTDAPAAALLGQRLEWATPPGAPQRHPPVVLLHDGRGDAPGWPAHGESLLLALQRWLPTLRVIISEGQRAAASASEPRPRTTLRRMS